MRWCFYGGRNRFIFFLFVLLSPVASNTVSQLWIPIPVFHLFPCSCSICYVVSQLRIPIPIFYLFRCSYSIYYVVSQLWIPIPIFHLFTGAECCFSTSHSICSPSSLMTALDECCFSTPNSLIHLFYLPVRYIFFCFVPHLRIWFVLSFVRSWSLLVCFRGGGLGRNDESRDSER